MKFKNFDYFILKGNCCCQTCVNKYKYLAASGQTVSSNSKNPSSTSSSNSSTSSQSSSSNSLLNNPNNINNNSTSNLTPDLLKLEQFYQHHQLNKNNSPDTSLNILLNSLSPSSSQLASLAIQLQQQQQQQQLLLEANTIRSQYNHNNLNSHINNNTKRKVLSVDTLAENLAQKRLVFL